MKHTLLVLLVLFLIFSGCKKELGIFPLNEMKDENPYNGTETIKYLSNNGDTIIFIGQGRYSEEIRSPYDGTSRKKYYSNEIDRCTFSSRDNNYELYIQLASRTSRGSHNSPSPITGYQMDMWFKDKTGTDTNCRSIADFITIPLSKHYDSDFYYDSLLINGIYYYNVLSFQDYQLTYSGDCFGRMKVDTLFYNTTSGIVKISFTDSTTWELINIENN